MVPADHAPTRQPDAENTTPSQLNYWNGLFLAPMVRIGSLPTRLLSLEYGADLVWGPEIVDRAIIGTTRQVDGECTAVTVARASRKEVPPRCFHGRRRFFLKSFRAAHAKHAPIHFVLQSELAWSST